MSPVANFIFWTSSGFGTIPIDGTLIGIRAQRCSAQLSLGPSYFARGRLTHEGGAIRSQSTMHMKLSIAEVTIDARANCLARVSEAARALAATHVQEKFGDGSSQSRLGTSVPIDRVQRVPERDRWLGPIISPARTWQFRSKSTVAAVVGLVGLMAAAAIGDVIPIGQFASFDLWRQIASDRKELASRSAPRVSALSSVSAEPAIARVVVQASREKSGNPTRLGLALQGQPEGAVVIITG